MLGRRQALAREARLVHRQAPRLEQARVGRDGVARREHQQIARHQLRGRHGLQNTGTNRECERLHRAGERLDGLLGLRLGDIAERRIDHDHGQDDERVGQTAGEHRHHGRGTEQRHRQRAELAEKHAKLGAQRRLGQQIGPVLF